MNRVVAVAGGMLLALPAVASDWVPVSRIPGEWTLFMDREKLSIETGGTMREAWFKIEYKKPKRQGGKFIAKYTSRERFNCAAGEQMTMAWSTTFTDGSADGNSIESLWGKVFPDSLGEDEFKFICGWPGPQRAQ